MRFTPVPGCGREEQSTRGLCPACGHENEDLAHLWWNGKAEQYAHIREKVPQNTTVEAMHMANRDMMLAQKDTQRLDWERNNTTNEIAAVAAAERLRSRVEDARNRDDGSKMSAGKAAEELGGYLCDGRLQVWTDGSCLDPRWEAIVRAGAGVYFSKNSKLNMHFSIKARTGQVRGELEAATCAILALDMPTRIHTDCEWVKKGIQETSMIWRREKRQEKENTLRSGPWSKKEPNPSQQGGWRWSTSLETPRKRW